MTGASPSQECVPNINDWVNELTPDLRAFPDEFLEITNLKQWVRLVRVPQHGKLDMQATAEGLGIPLAMNGNVAFGSGVTFGKLHSDADPLRITINPFFEPSHQQFTFGHEMGHIYLEILGFHHTRRNQTEEDLCEAIAREFVLPIDDLNDISNVDKQIIEQLVDKYGTSIPVTIFQLMRARKLPSKVAIDTCHEFSPNPEYAGKVNRVYFCYDCELGQSCAATETNISVFDFTDKVSSLGTHRSCRSEADYLYRRKLREALNEHYFPEGIGQLVLYKISELEAL